MAWKKFTTAIISVVISMAVFSSDSGRQNAGGAIDNYRIKDHPTLDYVYYIDQSLVTYSDECVYSEDDLFFDYILDSSGHLNQSYALY